MLKLIEELRTPLPALTRRQWLVLAVLFFAIAATRLVARSQSLADWDETLFCLAVGEYDVAEERPHAPGYPLFIAAAQLMRLVRPTDFKALQAVVTLSAMLLFPAIFFFARELRLRFGAALAAAILLMFLPTVWYFGGTGLSDIPALLVTTVACTLLVHGARDARFFYAGMFAAACAAGIRPQTVMITAIVGIIAAYALGSWRTFAIGCAIAAAMVIATYASAIWLSSDPPYGYIRIWKHTSGHVNKIDSYQNPHRPSLPKLAYPFLVQPFRGGAAGGVIVALAALGVIASFRHRVLWIAIAAYLPMALFSWVMLDITSMTRYAVGYLPMYVVLAASGLGMLASFARRFADAFMVIVAVAIAAALAWWTWPTLKIVRSSDAPMMSMFKWLREHVSPHEKVYLHTEFFLQSRYLFGDRDYTIVYDEQRNIPEHAYKPGSYLAVEGFAPQPQTVVFTRYEAGRLFEIARPRYRAVSLIPLESHVRYGRGWHETESNHVMWWRWMTRRASITLRPFDGDGELRLTFVRPMEGVPHAPTITVKWNGLQIDQRMLNGAESQLRYVVPSRRGALNQLELEVDVTARAPGDRREFGLMLQDIGWKAASASSPR